MVRLGRPSPCAPGPLATQSSRRSRHGVSSTSAPARRPLAAVRPSSCATCRPGHCRSTPTAGSNSRPPRSCRARHSPRTTTGPPCPRTTSPRRPARRSRRSRPQLPLLAQLRPRGPASRAGRRSDRRRAGAVADGSLRIGPGPAWCLSVGGDLWRSLRAQPGGDNSADIGIGRFKRVERRWRLFTMTTVSDAVLDRAPLPEHRARERGLLALPGALPGAASAGAAGAAGKLRLPVAAAVGADDDASGDPRIKGDAEHAEHGQAAGCIGRRCGRRRS